LLVLSRYLVIIHSPYAVLAKADCLLGYLIHDFAKGIPLGKSRSY